MPAATSQSNQANDSSALTIVKRVKFSSAHFFYLPHLSDAENKVRFGPTSNRNGHGHNYELEVTLGGPMNDQTGMLANLIDVKVVLKKAVIDRFDFNSLNHDVPFFKENLPTLENLSVFIWALIEPEFKTMGLTLVQVRVKESDDLMMDYRGEAFDALSKQLQLSTYLN